MNENVKTATRAPVMEARGIHKAFGQVQALRGAEFKARAGEVTALIGDNGAGKSSLVKVLSGVYTADEGELLIDGKPVRPGSPQDVRAYGIETVYQDLALAGDLTPYENVFMGRELRRSGVLGMLGVVDRGRMRDRTEEVFDALNVRIKDHKGRVAALSGGQRQSVAIARAAMWASHLVMMDEPTAALGVAQTQSVLELIRRVADSGIGVILISHNMTDVLEVADSIQVLRLGTRVATFRRGEATVADLVKEMTSGKSAEVNS
ncbi:ATP-binding cassette domain-containing protein [Actinacidiphila oryziradicis]|uniref:Sugar ABC transporter ATP-binding protein n=1 Tax=Actinacidiphila oryziradicis TaxID=2571141 RepID=A0A4U0SII1_9ACTN|nr:ATP-binding cassette domain-containing protein [Actinacidiphila oryziradicis]TKA08903.1 sugar ABC transporter ATP-binding protein [Actinacidiphila oryziradicis]